MKLLVATRYWTRPSNLIKAFAMTLAVGVCASAAGDIVRLSELEAGTGTRAGVVFAGETSSQIIGDTLASIGDFNGDGTADLAACGFRARVLERDQAGRCYVALGGDYATMVNFGDLAADGRGFDVFGGLEDDQVGKSVAGLGDINGDGLDDVAFGAFFASDGDREFVGKTFVLFGTPPPYASIDLGDFEQDPAGRGFVLVGDQSRDISGAALAGGQDLNGDGISDFAIGSYLSDPAELSAAGRVYVIYGRAAGDAPFAPRIELATLGSDGDQRGVVIEGHVAGLTLGDSLAAMPDITGDGLPDLVIGASRANSGFVFVLAGRSAQSPSFRPSITTGELDDWFPVVITGSEPRDRFGAAISYAGDFDGDGNGDLAIGAPNASSDALPESGRGYVMLDVATRASLSSVVEGEPADRLIIFGDDSRVFTGFSVAGGGDINGDGVDDALFGAYQADAESRDAGESYLVFGGDPAINPGVLTANGPEAALTSFFGAGLINDSGHSVAMLDFNGDGVDDVAIGAPGSSINGQASGAVYVVYGVGAPSSQSVSLSWFWFLALCLGVVLIAFSMNRSGAHRAASS